MITGLPTFYFALQQLQEATVQLHISLQENDLKQSSFSLGLVLVSVHCHEALSGLPGFSAYPGTYGIAFLRTTISAKLHFGAFVPQTFSSCTI
ncbi:hypothetical protein LshimejAT787_0502500 [Lyophyllum shimeji]|uniref:Uncharacterized protein n=1 Tax=Lyophyllum shimeji TaxID=47721 RepID=A0A9P3PL85_LYOSH|nr:hypothetical protein LshimejAT787_0502500 [Lyophyllum shimeji]